jgi:hypothetical protein
VWQMGEAHLRLGEAHFELNKFPKALEALASAEVAHPAPSLRQHPHVCAGCEVCAIAMFVPTVVQRPPSLMWAHDAMRHITLDRRS